MLSEAVNRIVAAAEEADSQLWESLAEEGFYTESASTSSDESEVGVSICAAKGKMAKKGKKVCSAPKRSLKKVTAEKVVPRKSKQLECGDLIALRTIVSAPF